MRFLPAWFHTVEEGRRVVPKWAVFGRMISTADRYILNEGV